ncbi:unnamed protein product, partial [Linum tenue]
MVGSLGNIYQSMGDLKQPSCFSSTNWPLLLPPLSPAAAASSVGRSHRRLSSEGSLVKEQNTFMVMDDLKASPLSFAVSAITMLNKLGCRDLGALEEKEVEFGNREALELLVAALLCMDIPRAKTVKDVMGVMDVILIPTSTLVILEKGRLSNNGVDSRVVLLEKARRAVAIGSREPLKSSTTRTSVARSPAPAQVSPPVGLASNDESAPEVTPCFPSHTSSSGSSSPSTVAGPPPTDTTLGQPDPSPPQQPVRRGDRVRTRPKHM